MHAKAIRIPQAKAGIKAGPSSPRGKNLLCSVIVWEWSVGGAATDQAQRWIPEQGERAWGKTMKVGVLIQKKTKLL